MVAWRIHAFAHQITRSTATTSAGHTSNAPQTNTALGTTSAKPVLAPTYTAASPARSAQNGRPKQFKLTMWSTFT